MTRPLPAVPSASLYRDMEEEDNQRGPERDETDTFYQLVRPLMANDPEELSRKLAEVNKRSSQGSGR
ncbi:hypothetical protein ACPB9J_31975 [Streptomyces lavendulocolor]|uniref:hypothetical protein n=1 Tax=Streptomyces lavendulocolor TaxID=67316 RepID=UPI003C2E18FB